MTNNCCRQEAAPKTVRLTFLRKELLYDAQNYAYIEADVMGEEKQHAQHMLADICEEGNVDRVSRILSVVHAAVVEMLYPFTKEAPADAEIDDKLEAPEQYEIVLSVPDGMSQTTVNLLSKQIHEYMVYRVMADWLTITNPAAAQAWMGRAEDTATEIEKSKNLRRRPQERKMSTF